MAENKAELNETVNEPREGARAEEIRTEGNDAVCFTAGLAGTAFGAGTIHAYLSADRDPPKVAAGISMGALNAAAMQRVYRELQQAAPKHKPPSGEERKGEEAARWRWFRQYVEALADRPLNIFWDAIPDQSDFFADMIPIHDTSTPPYLQGDELAARRDRYLLVKLGRWMARLPVKVSQLASAIVNYVRIKEKYPVWEKVKGGAALAWTALVMLTSVILHGFLSPEFFPEHKFQPPQEPAKPPKDGAALAQAQAEPKPAGVVRRVLRWLRTSVFSKLNVFSLSVVLGGTPAGILLGSLFSHSHRQGESLNLMMFLGGSLLGGIVLSMLTLPVRKWVMNWSVTKKFFLPLFGWGFSALNFLLLGLMALYTAVVVCDVVYRTSRPGSWWLTLMDLVVSGSRALFGAEATDAFWLGLRQGASEVTLLAAGMLVVFCFLFSPLVIMPESRQWLQGKGFLRKWPRPLFGWGTYFVLGLNVLSLAGYLLVGFYLIGMAVPSLWTAAKVALKFVGYDMTALSWIPAPEAAVWKAGATAGAIKLLFYLFMIPLLPVLVSLGLVYVRSKGLEALRGRFAPPDWLHKVLGWSEGIVFLAVTLYLAASACYRLLETFTYYVQAARWHQLDETFTSSGLLLALTWVFFLVAMSHSGVRGYFLTKMLARLELSRKLIHDYYLRLWLSRLFETNWKKLPFARASELEKLLEKLDDQPFPVMLVVAPLQTLLDDAGRTISARQLWANKGTPMVKALRTALAVPKLFEPTRIRFDRKQFRFPAEPWKWVASGLARLRKMNPWKQEQTAPQKAAVDPGSEMDNWLGRERVRNWAGTEFSKNQSLDLVDGAVVRKNPLQSLFGYLSEAPAVAQAMEEHNDEKHPAIHVVYSVPLSGPPAARPATGDATQEKPEEDIWQRTNVVENGLTSLRLAERRDTKLEVEQTNMLAQLETVIRDECGNNTGGTKTLKIFADQIAPEKDFEFSNPLNPNRTEILKAVAAGCRGTLQVLYKDQLALGHGEAPTVHCPAFLARIAKPRRVGFLSETPGLTEVCQHCTKQLARPAKAAEKKSPKMLEEILPEKSPLDNGKPRIVFVASGGVFRGAFHIGMIATLQLCEIKPDLIVGASVGTLMGGALGATFAFDPQIPARLVDTFLRVDETVALTRTLKSAARELGIRGRAVKLSPRAMRRMVLRGSRSDPGFAAAGAPPALIDAISDLFMIPHDKTKEIAGKFISGKVTGALHVLIEQLRTETIQRLDIERAVIGTALLEPVARQLLAADRVDAGTRQPFLRNAGIAYFGMTTNLVTQSSVVLGGEDHYPGVPYDYVEAALASSAFPAVFAPRQESNVYPGRGNADTLFADGGLFDNLPFLPAIDILARGQRSYRMSPEGKQKTALAYLGERLAQPDLLLAGALNAVPERPEDARRNFDTIKSITARADSLQDNVKIRAFEFASRRVYGQLQRFHRAAPATAQQTGAHFVDGVVNAGVLPVFPASADHLNGTFAFCKAMQLDAKRVCTSIADGCYQTLRALSREQAEASKPGNPNRLEEKEMLTAKSVLALVQEGRIPKLKRRESILYLRGNKCPFFEKEAGTEAERKEKRRTTPVEELKVVTFRCPFAKEKKDPFGAQMNSVFQACKGDSVHWNHEDSPSGR